MITFQKVACTSRLVVLSALLGCLAEPILPQISPVPYVLRFSKAQADGNKGIQVIYYLSGKFPHFSDDEPEVGPAVLAGESVARIPTRFDEAEVTGLSALVYQPGCLIQYLSIEDLKKAPHSTDVPCVQSEPVRLEAMIQIMRMRGRPT